MNATAYHVTTEAALSKILSEGLEALIGDRSSELGEKLPAVYLFPTESDLESGLGGWLGECFDEDETLHVLEVNIENLVFESEVEWELIFRESISPDRITYLRSEQNFTNCKSFQK